MEVDLSGTSPRITHYELMPVKGYTPDPEVAKILEPYLVKANSILGKKVGVTTDVLKGGWEAVNNADSPIGGFITEANRKAVNADISFVHARGVRAGLPKGPITARDLLSVSPFGNTVTSAELSGEEVWKTTQLIYDKYIKVPGENTWFSAGFKIEVENHKVVGIKLNGKDIPRTATGSYKVATGNFLTEMVPEFEFIKKKPTYVNHKDITEVIAMENYLKKNPTLDPQKLIHHTFSSGGGKQCGQQLMNLLKSL